MSSPPSAPMSPIDLPVEPLTMRELTEALINHYGLHTGKYDLVLEFSIGVGPVGPSPDQLNPGAMVAVSKIGLQNANINSTASVDAAAVNPKPKKPRPKKP